MQHRNKFFLFALTTFLAGCSNPTSHTVILYDTSFHLLFVGNMFRHEGAVPEGYVDYSRYFKSSSARFSLDAEVNLLFTEKREDRTVTHEFNGTYTATRAYQGGGFDISINGSDNLNLIWAPNWHDAVSTPYEAYLAKAFYIEELGQTITVVFSYICDYLSEM